MKIKLFGIVPEEIPYIEEWKHQHPGVTIDITDDLLTGETAHDTKGYDAIRTLQLSKIPAEAYKTLADNGVKVVAQRSAGTDMHDIPSANENGLVLTHVPSYSPETIAEYTIQQILRLIRKADLIEQRVEQQNFTWPGMIMGRVLGELTVAVIGVGRIGSRVAKILSKGFGSRVVAYDINPHDEFKDYVEYQDTLIQAVSQADIVTVHTPLDESTHHLINGQIFSQFKDQTVFINAARGGVVDTEAMLEAIESGKVVQAAIDVYEYESPYIPVDWTGKKIEDPIFQTILDHDRIVYTPHVAYFTDTAVRNILFTSLNSAYNAVKTGQDVNQFN